MSQLYHYDIQINFQYSVQFIIFPYFNSQFVKMLIEVVLLRLKIRDAQVSLLFCSDLQMQELNYRFLGKNYPTDVLSFPDQEGVSVSGFLGDIAVSVEKAYLQSILYGHGFLEEIARLNIHGLLHLLGYDHEVSLEEEKIMFSLERRLLSEVKKIFYV